MLPSALQISLPPPPAPYNISGIAAYGVGYLFQLNVVSLSKASSTMKRDEVK